MTNINTQEARRQIRQAQLSKGAILGGLVAASALGRLVFKPRLKLDDALFLAYPLSIAAFTTYQTSRITPASLDQELQSRIDQAFADAVRLVGLSKVPELLVSDSHKDEAITVGVLNPKVIISQGLIESQTQEELTAILCHELAHVKNGDTRGALLIGAATALALKNLVEPISELTGANKGTLGAASFAATGLATRAVGTAYSRHTESMADATAAIATEEPIELADALVKFRVKNGIARKLRVALGPILRTHPGIETRLENLARIAG